MIKEPRDNGTILPGLKPVLELLEREPEKVDVVYVRKGRASADSDRILDLCRDYGVRFQLVGDDVLSRMAACMRKSSHGMKLASRRRAMTP